MAFLLSFDGDSPADPRLAAAALSAPWRSSLGLALHFVLAHIVFLSLILAHVVFHLVLLGLVLFHAVGGLRGRNR